MSEPDRDAEVSQRYRELASEEPPGALDARILAAARDESELHPAPLVAPTARKRWYVPVAAAAVIVLSVIVTLQLQREPPDGEQLFPGYPSPTPSPQPESRTSVAPPPRSSARDAAKAPAKAIPELHEKRAASTSRSAPAAAAPEPGASPPPRAAETRSDAKQGAAQGASAESAAKPVQDALSPEVWLARIVELRRAGRDAEANESYAAFRRRYPDYRIAPELREQVLPR